MDITTRDRAVMLMLLCFYKKKADGETIFRFNNGIEIIQYPSGYVKYVLVEPNERFFILTFFVIHRIFMKMSKATIMMDPNVAAAICIDDCNICTSRNNINARKGDMMINAINGVIRSQTPIQ